MPHAVFKEPNPQAKRLHSGEAEIGPIFHRPGLAAQFAAKLMSKASVDGLLISGPRRTGKSTFVRHDLMPLLQADSSVHVIYIDFRAAYRGDAGRAINEALTTAMHAFDGIVMKAARRMGLINVKVGGLEMNVEQALPTYAKSTSGLLEALYKKAGKRLVFLLDEVELSRNTEQGRNALLGLGCGAVAINLLPGPGVRILATGSRPHKLSRMTSDRNEAFYAAELVPLPPLGNDFLMWARIRMPVLQRPDPRLLRLGFDRLLHRPREFLKVCETLIEAEPSLPSSVDELFQLLVDRAAADGKSDFMARLAELPRLGLALARTMAEFGERFAPHLDPCQRRLAALLDKPPTTPLEDLFPTQVIESALNGLTASGLLWRDLGFRFEEPRAAEWLLAMEAPGVDRAQVEQPSVELQPPPGLDFPTLPS